MASVNTVVKLSKQEVQDALFEKAKSLVKADLLGSSQSVAVLEGTGNAVEVTEAVVTFQHQGKGKAKD